MTEDQPTDPSAAWCRRRSRRSNRRRRAPTILTKRCRCRAIRARIFLGGLFGLALLAALYAASEIVLPMVLAIVLKLLLQPFVRVLDRLGVPRGIGALIAMVLLVLALAGLISALTGPAADWAGKLPSALPQVEQKLAFLHRPISAVQSAVR